ncbi:molybdenum cofactor biosynthesis protein MoaC [Treponema phagedenis]|uniref:MOSC domain protein n=1 Tax=Treponema phagedenis TaxID=162 RepID=A0A0B7GUE3_TREPH|nr:MOSC domain-containing protein [Treponema phagedenis]EFW37465.1 MOSC domain protein [Treponema phagedenis F0421]NVP24777.1 molybdenum cofactor biosynthesis protein MoaC [Treponema phagedenis]QEJ95887.1 molybdenum cofactor biosynthesis protein MoaC [Treponema phagedenis]QEJ98891.1 molybdenum cofactor biosynthesis protein MoaC [Treponema phagedenis]QEK00415.1 molybdenum cofactor biosynthesis protein MoaC [Treponema phagedenis]
MGTLISINISPKRQTVKKEVTEANLIENFGIENDAHGGNWHRQVSLLSYESFLQFKDTIKIPMEHGIFGENLLISGIDFSKIKIGDRIIISNAELEVTQIGKDCHKGCEIKDIVGRCIMPEEGVFSKVIQGGAIKKGDAVCLKSIL